MNFAVLIKLFVKDMFWHPPYNSSCSSVCFNEFSSSLEISSRWWCHKLYDIQKCTIICMPSHGCMDAWCMRWIIMTCILGIGIFISGMMTLLNSYLKWLWLKYRIYRVHFDWYDIWSSISMWWMSRVSTLDSNFYFSIHSHFICDECICS